MMTLDQGFKELLSGFLLCEKQEEKLDTYSACGGSQWCCWRISALKSVSWCGCMKQVASEWKCLFWVFHKRENPSDPGEHLSVCRHFIRNKCQTSLSQPEKSENVCVSVVSDLSDPMDCSLSGSSVHGDSPGKNTGVGCHTLLQGIFPIQGSNLGLLHYKQILYHLSHGRKVKVLVTQLCLTLWDPTDCGPPGSSVHGVLQARILEWVAVLISRGSSWPRDCTRASRIAGRFFTISAAR